MPDMSSGIENTSSAAEEDTPLNKDEMKFQFGTPKQEIDEPLEFSDQKSTSDELEPHKLEIAEKDKDRREKRYFSAVRLIIGCLVFLGIIYVIEVLVSLFGKSSPDVTNGIIEIIKTLLFTLSGYLFARKENGD